MGYDTTFPLSLTIGGGPCCIMGSSSSNSSAFTTNFFGMSCPVDGLFGEERGTPFPRVFMEDKGRIAM